MALVRWEPFEGLTALRREMDRLFEDFSTGGGALRFWERAAEPAVEVSDTAEAVVVKVQVPGITKDDVHLTITENALTVKGEMKEEEKKEEKNYHRREFRYGAFVRTIALPAPVQAREGDCPTQGRCPRSHHAEERSGTSQAHPHPGILTPQRQAAAGSQPRRLGCAERGQSHPGCNL